jgi:hypothetical protein
MHGIVARNRLTFVASEDEIARKEKAIHRLLEHLEDATHAVMEGSLIEARMEVLGAIYVLNTMSKRGGGGHG